MGAKEVSSFFTGFFVGALIGGATALLMAPQSGEETRAQIRDAGIELKEKAEATLGEVAQQLEEQTVEMRARTGEISSKLDQVLAQSKDGLSRLGKRGEEPVPVVESVEEAPAEA
jgi:gas vesicle protein